VPRPLACPLCEATRSSPRGVLADLDSLLGLARSWLLGLARSLVVDN
jgi:hypothetical protein